MKLKTVVMVAAPIAISERDSKQWGCPYCGYRSFQGFIHYGGCAVVSCSECGQFFHILGEGILVSPIKTKDFAPKLSPHPRDGIPKHGKPDMRPEEGEFFKSRGIGLDLGSCFICGTEIRCPGSNNYLNNIAAFVQCKEAGERVVGMFEKGAHLDYREHEVDRVQVKVCACDEHLAELMILNESVRDGVITTRKIEKAIEKSFDISGLACEIRPFIISFILNRGYSQEQADKFAEGYFEEVGNLPLLEKLKALSAKDDRCMKVGFVKAGIEFE